MKDVKKIAIYVILFCSVLLGIVTYAQTETTELLPIDAVLVLDVSRSMITADPDRLANKAMNMFIEMLEPGQNQVGVVAYAGHVTFSREMVVLCENEIEYLQHVIYGLEYASWTDHPLGLLEAIRIMYEGHIEGRQPIIIFFTDGNFNINPSGARTAAEAKYDKALAISLAQKHSFPVYSIGLNYDGQLDRRYIEIVAYETGGLAFETAHAEEIPDIISTIFSLMQTLPTPAKDLPEPTTIPEPPIIPAMVIETSIYIPQEPENNGRWIFVLTIALLLMAISLFIIFRKPKRVFTGRLAIEVVDNITRTAAPPYYRNLIEYGNRTTLQKLIMREINPALNYITLLPSPYAPSYLPQLLVKCKDNRQVKFTKDFVQQDLSAGLTINPGAEIIISMENEPMEIRLRYVI